MNTAPGRYAVLLIAAACFMLAAAPPAAAEQGEDVDALRFVAVNGLNLRTGPGIDHGVAGNYGTNDEVLLLHKQGKWAKVRVRSSNNTGWMHSDYLRYQPLPEAGDGTEFPLARIAGDRVNLRDRPSIQSRVKNRLSDGSKVYVVLADEPWFFVSAPSVRQRGWVHSELLEWMPRADVSGASVRMRRKPSTRAQIVEEIDRGKASFVIKESRAQWHYLASPRTGLSGWVHADYVSIRSVSKGSHEAAKFLVDADALNLREGPGTDHGAVDELSEGEEVTVVRRKQRWAKVLSNRGEGWVHADYLGEDRGSSETAESSTRTRSTSGSPGTSEYAASPRATKLVARSRDYLGTDYVWGGQAPGGFDCSGYIYFLLKDIGYPIPDGVRTSFQMFDRLGKKVGYGQLKPGDLVFFSTYRSGASHMGIYLGNGEFIHASSARDQVTINRLDRGYYKRRFLGGKRL